MATRPIDGAVELVQLRKAFADVTAPNDALTVACSGSMIVYAT